MPNLETSTLTRFVLRGRLIKRELILPVTLNRIPTWFESLIAPYTERFALDSSCSDHWESLRRMSGLEWRGCWGSLPTADQLFISEPIPLEDQKAVVEVARALKLDVAMAIDRAMLYRHVLTLPGVWR